MSSRIAKNTFLLYVRMMIVMVVNLIMVRIVLRALGVEDYGLYQVVAGVVITFQSLSSVIATSTQRFYSYSIGEGCPEKLSKIFSASINIYIWCSLGCFMVAETLGLWFVNTQLHLPPDRLEASNWIYQFAIFSFILTLLQAPYSSAVVAYEEMGFFAAVSMGECFLKLGAVIAIYFSHYDRLVLYGLSLMIVPGISLLAYRLKVRQSYGHVKYCRVKDRLLYHRMLSFSGWHLFSTCASVGMIQVNTILINLFFTLAVNAARGIALQVMSAFSSFSSSFILAVRAPIIKAYAEGNFELLNRLFAYSNKFIYYMTLLIAFPLYFQMETILRLWLGECTGEMVLFSKLIVIYSVILALNNPISIIIQATGKIRQYFVPVEIFTLLCPVITYFLFKAGFPASSTFYAMIGTIAGAHIVRVWCLNRYYEQFSLKEYILSFLLPASIITGGTGCTLFEIKEYTNGDVFLFIIASTVLVCVCAYSFGMNESERGRILSLFHSVVRHPHDH